MLVNVKNFILKLIKIKDNYTNSKISKIFKSI